MGNTVPKAISPKAPRRRENIPAPKTIIRPSSQNKFTPRPQKRKTIQSQTNCLRKWARISTTMKFNPSGRSTDVSFRKESSVTESQSNMTANSDVSIPFPKDAGKGPSGELEPFHQHSQVFSGDIECDCNENLLEAPVLSPTLPLVMGSHSLPLRPARQHHEEYASTVVPELPSTNTTFSKCYMHTQEEIPPCDSVATSRALSMGLAIDESSDIPGEPGAPASDRDSTIAISSNSKSSSLTSICPSETSDSRLDSESYSLFAGNSLPEDSYESPDISENSRLDSESYSSFAGNSLPEDSYESPDFSENYRADSGSYGSFAANSLPEDSYESPDVSDDRRLDSGSYDSFEGNSLPEDSFECQRSGHNTLTTTGALLLPYENQLQTGVPMNANDGALQNHSPNDESRFPEWGTPSQAISFEACNEQLTPPEYQVPNTISNTITRPTPSGRRNRLSHHRRNNKWVREVLRKRKKPF